MAQNPVTFRATFATHKSDFALTMARMHVGVGDKMNHFVPLVMSNERTGEVVADLIADETHVLVGLRELFPDGEFEANILRSALVQAIGEIKRLGGDASRFQQFLPN